MKSSRMLFIVAALFVCIIAGCTGKEAEGIENEFPPSMAGLILINGTEHPMEEGNYTWERKKGFQTETVQTDHASPFQMAEQIKPVNVTPNETIEIQIEDNPKMKVFLWNKGERGREVKRNGNQIAAPSSTGRHIYEVLAEWPNGTVSYTFVLNVQ